MGNLHLIADEIGATLSVPVNLWIARVSAIANAGPESLVFIEKAAGLEAAIASGAGAIIAPPGTATNAKPLLLSANPKLAFARAARFLKDGTHSVYVDPTASVAAPELLGRGIAIDQYVVMGRVSVGDGTVIKPGCAIATGSSIGRDCVLHPRVTIYPGVTLGDRVVVHAGAVLGADGFGYVRDPATGEYIQFPQQGTLIVEDDVEIGANTTIDRGALEETRIGKGTKIDNLVHIGHNVRVGRNVVIAAQTGISGSTVIGDGAVIGGQVGMGDHATVGQGVIVGSGAGILPHKKLHGPGQVFWGVPAKPLHQHLKELATIAKLAKAPTASQSEPRQGRPYPEEGK